MQVGADSVVDAVLGASRALVAIAARSLSSVPGDVTLPQYRLLVMLAGSGPHGVTGLAGELDAALSSVTRLCDRLVAKGLIDRRPAPGSRREVEIVITAAGRSLVDTVTAARRVDVERVVAAIPMERRLAVVEALREFAAAAGEAPEQAWSLGWDT